MLLTQRRDVIARSREMSVRENGFWFQKVALRLRRKLHRRQNIEEKIDKHSEFDPLGRERNS